MKTNLLLVAWMMAVTGVAQEAVREIRIVNGVSVDLTPVIEWMQKPGTNARPMAHWKAIRVQSIRKQVAGWDVCTVTTESGQSAEILLANMPAEVRRPLVELAQVDARIAAMRAGAQAASAQSVGVLGNGPRASAARDGAAQQSAVLQGNIAELTKVRERMAGDAAAARGTKLLAMDTGRRYAGAAVWDCGKARMTVGRF